MTFPLAQWETLERGSVPFGSKYPYNPKLGQLQGKRHVGTDVLCLVGTPIYAPFDGVVKKVWGKDGGNTILFKEEVYGYLHRMLHCNSIIKTGKVREGEIIGYTGKTGKALGAHLHYDISKNGKLELYNFNNFLDPEEFYRNLAEIKKNMKILLVFDNSLTIDGLFAYLMYVREFWSDVVNIEFNTKGLKLDSVPWEGEEISRKWLTENLIPWASGYDVCCLWLPPEKWQARTRLGYTARDKILGVQLVTFATTIGSTDIRFVGVPESNQLAGTLRHELSHALSLMTRGFANVNNSSVHVPGDDNTHYWEFVAKDLSRIKPEIDMLKFEGWKPKEGVRLYAYSKRPTKLKSYSGTFENLKNIEYLTDNFVYIHLFFIEGNAGKPILAAKLVSEEEYTSKVREGATHQFISIGEMNTFGKYFKLTLPEFKTKTILYEHTKVKLRELWLRLKGYSDFIPNRNL